MGGNAVEFHEKLQELRKKKGLTQEEVAQALFVSRTAVYSSAAALWSCTVLL